MPEEVKKAAKSKEKSRNDRNLSDIRKVLSFPEGRRLYWRILESGGIFKGTFSGDVNWTLFREGERNLALTFLNDLMKAKPEAFTQMQREKMSEAESNKREDERESKERSILDTTAHGPAQKDRP